MGGSGWAMTALGGDVGGAGCCAEASALAKKRVSVRQSRSIYRPMLHYKLPSMCERYRV